MLLGSLQETMLLLKSGEGKMQSPLEVQGVISGSVVQCFCTGDKVDLLLYGMCQVPPINKGRHRGKLNKPIYGNGLCTHEFFTLVCPDGICKFIN